MKNRKLVKVVATARFVLPGEMTIEEAEKAAFSLAEHVLPFGWSVDYSEFQKEIVKTEESENESH